MNSNLISNCCGSRPWLDEVDSNYIGVCSKCKEHAEFESPDEPLPEHTRSDTDIALFNLMVAQLTETEDLTSQ